MRKFVFLFLMILVLPGCAAYKFHHGQAPLDKGYVVSRDKYTIPEYTLGKDNTVPELFLARKRFTRRRDKVEHYYKQMGEIENRFKMTFADPVFMIGKLVIGVFRLPFIALSEYRYDHNMKYREMIRQKEQEKDLREEVRIKKVKETLGAFILQDLAKEGNTVKAASSSLEVKQFEPEQLAIKQLESKQPLQEALRTAETVQEEKASAQEAALVQAVKEPAVVELSVESVVLPEVVLPESAVIESSVETVGQAEVVLPKKRLVRVKKQVRKAPRVVKPAQEPVAPVALIIARPAKGYSPLTVRFSGEKSRSAQGRIIAYEWDFGDGDVSKKMNPVNTFYSASFEPVSYTITLTVTDVLGNTATTSANVEVLNK